jgi:predicted amidohydrolase
MNIKVGIAQTINSTKIEQNFKQIMIGLQSFQTTGVNLVLFPECSLSGFSAKMKEFSIKTLEPYLQKIQNWCKQTGINVVIPTALVENGSIYNSGFWITSTERHKFYKIGLTESEKKFFSIPEENQCKVFQCNHFNFGILICYEAENEPWSYFKKGDVDTILWPGYWGWKLDDKWDMYREPEKLNTIFKNMASWETPLLQSNFASNDIDGHIGPGPEGLSFVIGHDNQLIMKGQHHQIGGLVVELSKKNNQTKVTKCFSLEFGSLIAGPLGRN